MIGKLYKNVYCSVVVIIREERSLVIHGWFITDLVVHVCSPLFPALSSRNKRVSMGLTD